MYIYDQDYDFFSHFQVGWILIHLKTRDYKYNEKVKVGWWAEEHFCNIKM